MPCRGSSSSAVRRRLHLEQAHPGLHREMTEAALPGPYKPQVICLMASSVDGRTLHSRWRPKGVAGELFERVHDELAGDAWLVGRVTGQEFAKGKPYPASTEESFPREPWFARRDAQAYGVVLDARGKIAWGRSEIGGDPIVVVLTEMVAAGPRGA